MGRVYPELFVLEPEKKHRQENVIKKPNDVSFAVHLEALAIINHAIYRPDSLEFGHPDYLGIENKHPILADAGIQDVLNVVRNSDGDPSMLDKQNLYDAIVALHREWDAEDYRGKTGELQARIILANNRFPVDPGTTDPLDIN